jgi:ABC-2 type transport system ATP-binding protein
MHPPASPHADPAEPLLSVASLRVDFAPTVALDGVTFDLRAGDVCALIGPNGAGKTTLFKAILGLVPLTLGEVRVAGLTAGDDPLGFCRRVGFMPDAAPVWKKLLVREFLEHFAALYEVADADRRIAELLALTALASKADDPCGVLSKGMLQRLLLAKTLLHAPRVCLLDEPAAGLDPVSRVQLRDIVKGLAADGCAVVVSSHVLHEVSEFANRVLVLEQGVMRAFGDVGDIARTARQVAWRVRWEREDASFAAWVSGCPGIALVAGDTRSVEVMLEREELLDTLLAELTGRGLQLRLLRPAHDDLERILLDLDATRVM